MTKPLFRIAVIQFPGTNCEFETVAAVRCAGLDAEIFRWNRTKTELDAFDGYILPGGFSYQDRIRAGVVASRKKIMNSIVKNAEKGKPVLGICNGAQILIEAGMVPGIKWGSVEMCLSFNNNSGKTGYHCDWVYVKSANQAKPGCFNLCYSPNQVIPIPVAHFEGRFVTNDKQVEDSLLANQQIAFRYCTCEGEIEKEFPVNPNGSLLNIAGLYNPSGNVLALMPHPERAAWLRQIPGDLMNYSSKKACLKSEEPNSYENYGPGLKVFRSMKMYLERTAIR
jgi:phosphoribosylformylglycinamidine synthase subunit PurQ / glutaminase